MYGYDTIGLAKSVESAHSMHRGNLTLANHKRHTRFSGRLQVESAPYTFTLTLPFLYHTTCLHFVKLGRYAERRRDLVCDQYSILLVQSQVCDSPPLA